MIESKTGTIQKNERLAMCSYLEVYSLLAGLGQVIFMSCTYGRALASLTRLPSQTFAGPPLPPGGPRVRRAPGDRAIEGRRAIVSSGSKLWHFPEAWLQEEAGSRSKPLALLLTSWVFFCNLATNCARPPLEIFCASNYCKVNK